MQLWRRSTLRQERFELLIQSVNSRMLRTVIAGKRMRKLCNCWFNLSFRMCLFILDLIFLYLHLMKKTFNWCKFSMFVFINFFTNWKSWVSVYVWEVRSVRLFMMWSCRKDWFLYLDLRFVFTSVTDSFYRSKEGKVGKNRNNFSFERNSSNGK